jgi:hypothetical protein
MFAGVLVFAVAAVAVAQPQARFMVLAPESNEESILPTHLSADGSVVVGYGGGYLAPAYRVWRWTSHTGKQRLEGPAGAGDMLPAGVTTDGTTIFANVSQGGAWTLWRWTPSLGWQLVSDLGGIVRGISGDGGVVSGWSSAGNQTGSFRWTPQGGVESVLPLGTGTGSTLALAISRDGGTLVGTDSTLSAPSGNSFRWTSGTGTQLIPLLPGFASGQATLASQDGSVIAGSCHTSPTTTMELPYLWSAPGGTRRLQLTGPGGPYGIPTGMNGSGTRLVGRYEPGGETWIWSEAEGDQRLDAVLIRYGLDLFGESMRGGGVISEDSRTIAGPLGGFFAYIATIPACYANCDASTASPALNVADFTCFLTHFAAGDAYANCDSSTAPPLLTVSDFTCFLQRFAAGCP